MSSRGDGDGWNRHPDQRSIYGVFIRFNSGVSGLVLRLSSGEIRKGLRKKSDPSSKGVETHTTKLEAAYNLSAMGGVRGLESQH